MNMKWVALGMMALVGLSLAWGLQDRKACDCSHVEQRAYCTKCNRFLEPKDIDGDGRCLLDKVKADVISACIKTCFVCSAHEGRLHSRDCGAKKACCVSKTVPSRMKFMCDKCGESGFAEADVMHKKTACDGKLIKICCESGTFPHGGAEEKLP